MSDAPVDPQENLSKWAALHVQNTERDLAKSMFIQMLSQAGSLDGFSNWSLLLTGASITLVIPNLDAVLEFLPLGSVRWFLLLLLVSAIFGIAQKYFAMSVDMRLRISAAIEKEWQERFQAANLEEEKIQGAAKQCGATVDTAINLGRILVPVLEVLPWWVKWYALKKGECGLKDQLYIYKEGLRAFTKQGWCFALQCALLISAIFVIIVNVGAKEKEPTTATSAVSTSITQPAVPILDLKRSP